MWTPKLVILCSMIFSSFGCSPGAWFLEMTVRAEVCATDLTVAQVTNGSPMNPLIRPNTPIRKISRWKPVPFCSLCSFLFTIILSIENILCQCQRTFGKCTYIWIACQCQRTFGKCTYIWIANYVHSICRLCIFQLPSPAKSPKEISWHINFIILNFIVFINLLLLDIPSNECLEED